MEPNRTTQLEVAEENGTRVVSLTTFDPRSSTCSERVSVEAPASELTLKLDAPGHEMVLPERAYRREYQVNDHITRETAPLGVVQ